MPLPDFSKDPRKKRLPVKNERRREKVYLRRQPEGRPVLMRLPASRLGVPALVAAPPSKSAARSKCGAALRPLGLIASTPTSPTLFSHRGRSRVRYQARYQGARCQLTNRSQYLGHVLTDATISSKAKAETEINYVTGAQESRGVRTRRGKSVEGGDAVESSESSLAKLRRPARLCMRCIRKGNKVVKRKKKRRKNNWSHNNRV